jgi:divalent metal cation (Fe/Co/Zn/Cd) transporter
VTAARPASELGIPVQDTCCGPGGPRTAGPPAPVVRDAGWLRAARQARWLAWASLAWMCAEGSVGLWQGLAAGSAALTGWALGSAVEGLASVIVIWRFTGSRSLSVTAERRAQRGVAISFWLLAPYIGAESVRDLIAGHHPEATAIGMALTGAALLEMPLLGRAKRKLGTRLGSAATAGEGTQNYLCAAQAAAVLLALAVTAAWPAAGWLDPAIGLGIAAVAIREGTRSWRGDDCC